MRNYLGVAAFAAVVLAAPAMAVDVPAGTVASVALFTPAISMAADPATYTANLGGTLQIAGTGGFADLATTFGSLNGTISFSRTVGTTISETVANFFQFSDQSAVANPAGNLNYKFSVSSVTTEAVNASGTSTLSLLGTLLDANLGYTPTAAAITLQFNSTGGSAYSSSLTLAVPPAVPEPASWGLMLAGFGGIGWVMRRQRKVSVSFA